MENNDKKIVEIINELREKFVAVEDKKMEKEDGFQFLDSLSSLVQLILRDPDASLYTLLSKESISDWANQPFKVRLKKFLSKNINKIGYIALLASITIFLVSEAVTFYADGDIVNFKTYAKAILTEISFIFLSGYRAKGMLQTTLVSVLRVGIFSLMLFVISSETLLKGTKFVGNTDSITSQITLIEQQIAEKEHTIEFYKKKNWGRSVNIHVKEKDELVKKIIALKEQQAEGANQSVAKIVQYKSYGNAFFRVILLMISLLITRRIFSF